MSEWQTIETASKDGSYVDLVINGERKTDCRYLQGQWVSWDCKEEGYFYCGEPSHWMPIPKLPGQS